MSFYRDIEDVVNALKKAKVEGTNVNLLIGSGCSVTAGIPTAKGFTQEIKRRFASEYKRLTKKDYGTCMSMLTEVERKKIIAEFVNNAKINWAHLSIAQLVKCGYLNRILTTNFDNLLLRGCALVGEFPGVYDLATSQGFRPELLFDKSILYLHGQYTGFVLCNTKTEVETQKKNLQNVFSALKSNSLWIIAGYSGENDAISQLLAEEKSFDHRLFWVGFNDHEPSEYIKNSILGEDKYAFYIKDYDADTFFVKITQEMECFPSQIIEKPFTYLSEKLGELTDYKLKNEEYFLDVELINVSTVDIIKTAINNIENNKVLMANHYVKLGLFKKVVALLEKASKNERDEINKKFRNVFMAVKRNAEKFIEDNKDWETINNLKTLRILADAYITVARSETDKVRIKFLMSANDVYEKLFSMEYSDMLGNWADLLIEIAEICEDTNESLEYYLEAESKYFALQEADSENIQDLLSWSDLYIKIAALCKDDENQTGRYINMCIEKLNRANIIDPNNMQVLSRWGSNLIQMTLIRKNGYEEFIYEANEKFKLAHELNKSDITVLIVWAHSLFYIINRDINSVLKEKYINIAFEKFQLAYTLNPKNIATLNEWKKCIATLVEQNLYTGTYEKFFCEFFKVIKQNEKEIIGEQMDEMVNDINSMAYRLIYNDEFNISKQAIETCLSVKTTVVFQYATKGLWYLRNKHIDVKEAETEGNKFYIQSIELSQNGPDNVINALKQKHKYEMSLFMASRKNNIKLAYTYCKEASLMGIIEKWDSIYKEVEQLLSLITDLNKDVAVSQEI